MTETGDAPSFLARARDVALIAARVADTFPLAPKAIGRSAVRIQAARRRRVAYRGSPRWRELEARVLPGGFLRYDDMLEKRDIERAMGPDPRWLAAANLVQWLSAERGTRCAVRAAQRAWRGWSDEDLWSLGDTLRRTLGAQLTALAEQTNGYPGDGDWGEHGKRWGEALSHHGGVLSSHPRSTTERERTASQAAVRTSLHWVADHYQQLGW